MSQIQDINVLAKEMGAGKTLIVGRDSTGNYVVLTLNSDGTMAGGGGNSGVASKTFILQDSIGTGSTDTLVSGIPTAVQVTGSGSFTADLYASLDGVNPELIYGFTANTLAILPYPLNSAVWRLDVTANDGTVTAVIS